MQAIAPLDLRCCSMKTKRILCSVFALVLFLSTFLLAPSAAGVPAAPNTACVWVDGGEYFFDGYTIRGNHYFKLRDIANALSGTQKQFDVMWDGARNTIFLTAGRAYTVTSDVAHGAGTQLQIAVPTDARIVLDGKEIELTAYTIAGSNYFRLRDLAACFDFGVQWDGERAIVVLTSSEGYSAS